MFTGIIEEIGIIKRAEHANGGMDLRIFAPRSVKGLRVNDSVAINGVCLTVTKRVGTSFETTAVEETLKKTAFSSLVKGSRVNVELPMRLNERLGGHLVLGHVDTVGVISHVQRREGSTMYTVAIGKEFAKYIIPVGSIAMDGISLTIAEIGENSFVVSIIPHTMKHTIVGSYAAGTCVNIEFDLVGKYIERMAFTRSFPTEEELRTQGF